MELNIKNISKQFGDKTAVSNLNIKFGTGVYGLLGANGAGKTTLMRMICGISTPSEGVILLDGKTIQELGENYRDQLGYLPQDFGYYKEFSAKEFMLYIAALKGLLPRIAKKKTVELLELVGLSDVAGKKIKTYSGGMKQRLGIAQAMLNDPKILVLDEPTAGLDPKERVRFRNLLSDFAKDRLVILSTHIVSDLEYIADEILIMKKGSLIEKGTVEELVSGMEGKVWRVVTDDTGARKLCENHDIINLRHEGDSVELRVVADEMPTKDAEVVTPTLEDLYLYEFQDAVNE